MKTALITLAMVIGATANATPPDIQTSEYYVLNAWVGEYPTGYQILENTPVETVYTPTNPRPGPICTLRKDAVIHPWAQKTQSEFIYLSPVERYVAKRDFEIFSSETTNIQVKTGDEVIQLSYLAEGICLISANGDAGEDGCLSSEDDRATLVAASVFSPKNYFMTSCLEGGEAWIDAASLETLLGEEDASVSYAEIIDYGTVKEP